MASGPITSWQIDGETMETVTDFIFFSSKITADGDCGHEIKRHLLLERKTMTDIDSVLKSRDVTLPTKVLRVKAIVFQVVMYGCESWTIKKSECQSELVCSPWDDKESDNTEQLNNNKYFCTGSTVLPLCNESIHTRKKRVFWATC